MKQPRDVLCIVSLSERRTTQTVPLGAACLCSAVNADAELSERWRPVVIQGYIHESAEAILRRIGEENPRMIGFSIYVWNADRSLELARRMKIESPGIRLIAGGAEVTARPGDFAAADLFDFVIAGEGEGALVAELKAEGDRLEPGNAAQSRIAGVWRKGAVPASPRAIPCPLENLPSPYLDRTLDARAYEGLLWEISRGCPFRCGFCYESKGTGKVRRMPIDRLERELEFFVREDAGLIAVLDPTFNADPARATELLRLLKRKAPGLRYTFEVRAELLDKAQAKLFAELDCSVQIGIQSTNPQALANINRSIDEPAFARKIGLLNSSGAAFGFDLIYGIPGDTLEGFGKSLDFALGLRPNHLDIFPLAVLPGTELREKAAELGLEYDPDPPYTFLSSPGFDERDREKASDLCRACDLFYTHGRAVAWFASCIEPLRQKPSGFLEAFHCWARKSNRLPREDEPDSFVLEELQIDFIRRQYAAKGLARLLPAAESVIRLHSAYGRANLEGLGSTIELSYDPDQLFDPLVLNLRKFTAAMKKRRTRVEVRVKNGQVDFDY